jgi:stage II sporulation protein R
MRGRSLWNTELICRIFFQSKNRIVVAGCVLLLAAGALAGKVPAGAESNKLIPDDAIRIRIIANSDSKEDQAVKLRVRDKVAALIDSWGAMPSTAEEARTLIRAHLGEVRSVADAELRRAGVPYRADVVLAKVPFPAKTFEGHVYPAGNYEALRIMLGRGEGANWWCVLFPPLCLTAAAAADDRDAAAGAAEPARSGGGDAPRKAADERPHAKFFVAELVGKLIAWIGSLFS